MSKSTLPESAASRAGAAPDSGSESGDAAASFAPHRRHLVRVAYRMLGSLTEAEDIVQEAFLRWLGSDRALVRQPQAFLTRIVTRLCLDHLKSARATRETYIGPWLPEPVIMPESERDIEDDVTLTLMMALERLSPLERAAFLLHDVFGLGFDEVARAIDRDEAACRQLASRARGHVRAEKPRYPLPAGEGEGIATAFFKASRSGDVTALKSLLADAAIAYTDGGGKRMAAINPLDGADKIIRFFAGIFEKGSTAASRFLRYAEIDGLPGFISVEKDGFVQTTALDLDEEGRIRALYVVRNPDKLRHLQAQYDA